MNRKVEILLAIILIFFFSPLIFFVVLSIKLSSRGPLIYRQERVGLGGKCFILYKFRSMVIAAEKDSGPVLSSKNDTRVTAIGRILRKSRLDEIPQLINILKGDMSFVGPRPERPHFVKQHKSLQGIRLSVKPGLTGLAQIEGYYHTVPRNKLRYDYVYIKNKSLLLDLKIIFRTMIVVFTRPGS